MQPIKILVIEDSPLAMLAAKRIMAKMGLQADFVMNAEMALLLHYDNAYDLIFCDLRLPTMSSFSMALKIRSCERKYGLRNTKIIFMTSLDHRDIKTAVLAMGVDELLIKPLQAQCVMSLIELCQTQVVNA
jgi:DNA-binding response OmpR family regulator